jgi:putative cardiolipin synthase
MRSRSVILGLGLLVTLVTGCRSLPRDFDPPEPTHALDPPPAGGLARFADACAPRLGPDESGFLLLERGDEALRWRLALIDSAARSVDVQTFLWRGDFAGRLLIDRLAAAAERGVRVRLLVDDWYLRHKDRMVAAFDDHPNVEIRIWNPGRSRELGRTLEYAARLSELNHRMHNKAFIADNLVVISGGRNNADEYYGLSDQYNFLDVDVLGVGPVARGVSAMFDRYWNSHQAVPASIFDARASVEHLPRELARRRAALERSPLREAYPIERQEWGELLAATAPAVVPATVEVIYDVPGVREPSQDALFGLERFLDRAGEEVLMLNPYLVPGSSFVEAMGVKVERGVRVAILTNSLGSNDQTIVHGAYSRRRRPLLVSGVDLYEMRHDAAMKAELDTPPATSSFVGLHGKVVVLDRRDVFIGSFNLDPRSKNLNTEMGLLVHSDVLAGRLADHVSRAMAPDNAWRLGLDENGRLGWESSDGTISRQPAQSFWQRFQSGFFGVLPIEEHL